MNNEELNRDIQRHNVLLEEYDKRFKEVKAEIKELSTALNTLNIEFERCRTRVNANIEELQRHMKEMKVNQEKAFKKNTTIIIVITSIAAVITQIITSFLPK